LLATSPFWERVMGAALRLQSKDADFPYNF